MSDLLDLHRFSLNDFEPYIPPKFNDLIAKKKLNKDIWAIISNGIPKNVIIMLLKIPDLDLILKEQKVLIQNILV